MAKGRIKIDYKGKNYRIKWNVCVAGIWKDIFNKAYEGCSEILISTKELNIW